MGYHDILQVRMRLAGTPMPQHFGWGGNVGGDLLQGALAPVTGGASLLLPGSLGGVGSNNGFVSNVLTNPAKALTPQNGYTQATPEITQSNFQPGMDAGTNGYFQGNANVNGAINGLQGQEHNLNGVAGQQGSLAQALLAQSRGQGPNPAQQQFQNNQNQLLKQEAGAIASTKGLNPALAARMIADNAGQQQQAGAGQAGVLQAQQQLAEQQQAGTLLGQQAGTYGAAGQLAGTAGGLGVGQANAGAGFFGQNVNGQGNQNNAINTGVLGAGGINAGVQTANANRTGTTQAGFLNAVGGAGGLLGSSSGGESDVGINGSTGQGSNSFSQGTNPNFMGPPALADGGEVPDQSGSILNSILANTGAAANAPMKTSGGSGGGGGGLASLAPLAAAMAHGGEVDAKAMNLAQALMAMGGPVPGKAKYPGDNPKNDKVPTVLSPNEIVLPRSVTMAEDAPQRAEEFVEKLRAKSHPTYGRVLAARRAHEAAIAAHHKACGGYAAA